MKIEIWHRTFGRGKICLAAFLLLTLYSIETPAQSSNSGTVNIQASVSAFVEVRAGGPIALSGNVGGGVNNTLTKGSVLTGTIINLGDVGPANPNPFVKATVPLRLRSNAPYTLSMQVQDVSNFTGEALTINDVGFGLDNVSRSDPGVNGGTDTITTGMSGDPSLDPDANTATPRWDYQTKKNLGYFTTAQNILTGPKIMAVTPPSSSTSGLTLNTFFVVKPQFFTPTPTSTNFNVNVTFTITSP